MELDNRLITEILCLGLGNFSDCSSALHQLAFLIGINEKYQQHAKPIRIYDPVFTNCEKSILVQLQFEIILENLEGKHPAEDLTLFYFPHCLKELSNNLLWKNWSPKLLENVILISNSFKSIVDAIPTRLLKLNANYLLDIQQFVEEKELKNSNSLYKFFNDLSIHTFPRKIFEIIPAVLWEQNEEPVYIDLDDEFVRQEVNENGSSENSSCPA